MNWYAFLADLVAASAVGGCVAMILFSAAGHKFSELDIFAGALDAYQLLPSVAVIELGPIEWTGKLVNYAAICSSFL